jgi:hypothetical protein
MTSAKPFPKAPNRHRAVSMAFAADLDEHYVEMRIVTDTGEAFVVVCPRASIFAIQRQIERIGHDCPEIATWSRDPARATTGSVRALTVR